MTKVNLAGNRTGRDVDHDHLPAIGSRLSDARVSIDGHVGGPAIGRGCDLVPRDAPFRHRGQLLCRRRIDDAEIAVTLVGGHQERLYRRFGNSGGFAHKQTQGQRHAEREQYKVHGYRL